MSTALERLLTTLSSVERLMPLADNVFVVAPESHVRSLSLSRDEGRPFRCLSTQELYSHSGLG